VFGDYNPSMAPEPPDTAANAADKPATATARVRAAAPCVSCTQTCSRAIARHKRRSRPTPLSQPVTSASRAPDLTVTTRRRSPSRRQMRRQTRLTSPPRRQCSGAVRELHANVFTGHCAAQTPVIAAITVSGVGQPGTGFGGYNQPPAPEPLPDAAANPADASDEPAAAPARRPRARRRRQRHRKPQGTNGRAGYT